MDENKVYLAFLDILGFKDLIENNSLHILEKLYDDLNENIHKALVASNIERYPRPDSEFKQNENVQNLNSLFISDSIILWTDKTGVLDFLELCVSVQLIMNVAIKMGLPLRGAVTYDNLLFKRGVNDESGKIRSHFTLLGTSLTEAYLNEGQIEMSGCVVTDKCITNHEKEFQNWNGPMEMAVNVEGLLNIGALRKYKVPVKTGDYKEQYTIPWFTNGLSNNLSQKFIEESFSAHNKGTDFESVSRKIKNTKEYLTFLKSFDSPS